MKLKKSINEEYFQYYIFLNIWIILLSIIVKIHMVTYYIN